MAYMTDYEILRYEHQARGETLATLRKIVGVPLAESVTEGAARKIKQLTELENLWDAFARAAFGPLADLDDIDDGSLLEKIHELRLGSLAADQLRVQVEKQAQQVGALMKHCGNLGEKVLEREATIKSLKERPPVDAGEAKRLRDALKFHSKRMAIDALENPSERWHASITEVMNG